MHFDNIHVIEDNIYHTNSTVTLPRFLASLEQYIQDYNNLTLPDDDSQINGIITNFHSDLEDILLYSNLDSYQYDRNLFLSDLNQSITITNTYKNNGGDTNTINDILNILNFYYALVDYSIQLDLILDKLRYILDVLIQFSKNTKKPKFTKNYEEQSEFLEKDELIEFNNKLKKLLNQDNQDDQQIIDFVIYNKPANINDLETKNDLLNFINNSSYENKDLWLDTIQKTEGTTNIDLIFADLTTKLTSLNDLQKTLLTKQENFYIIKDSLIQLDPIQVNKYYILLSVSEINIIDENKDFYSKYYDALKNSQQTIIFYNSENQKSYNDLDTNTSSLKNKLIFPLIKEIKETSTLNKRQEIINDLKIIINLINNIHSDSLDLQNKQNLKKENFLVKQYNDNYVLNENTNITSISLKETNFDSLTIFTENQKNNKIIQNNNSQINNLIPSIQDNTISNNDRTNIYNLSSNNLDSIYQISDNSKNLDSLIKTQGAATAFIGEMNYLVSNTITDSSINPINNITDRLQDSYNSFSNFNTNINNSTGTSNPYYNTKDSLDSTSSLINDILSIQTITKPENQIIMSSTRILNSPTEITTVIVDKVICSFKTLLCKLSPQLVSNTKDKISQIFNDSQKLTNLENDNSTLLSNTTTNLKNLVSSSFHSDVSSFCTPQIMEISKYLEKNYDVNKAKTFRETAFQSITNTTNSVLNNHQNDIDNQFNSVINDLTTSIQNQISEFDSNSNCPNFDSNLSEYSDLLSSNNLNSSNSSNLNTDIDFNIPSLKIKDKKC